VTQVSDRTKRLRARSWTSLVWLAAVAGCTGQARLNELPEPTHAEPAAGASGSDGAGGSGGSAPLLPPPNDGVAIGEPWRGDAGELAAGRPPRPTAGGNVAGSIGCGAGAVVLEPTLIDLEAHGYVQEELLLEGVATEHVAHGDLGLDGLWEALPVRSAPYVSRLIVRRPKDAADFNGTVLVEWLKVTSGADTAMGFAFAREELLRGGYAWVGVSVQQTGVDALRLADPVRYAPLSHPGDAFAYSIYAQAGAAIGWPGSIDVMGGLPVERLIAYGQSLSAVRMITYVNAVHPLTRVYDGFIIHSRAGWGAPVGLESDSLLGDGTPVQVRSDLDVPVLQFITESEIFFPLGGTYHARQPDTARLRTWEIAGAAHADQHLFGEGADLGCGPLNDGPQHLVLKAAVRAMHRWLADGTPPPSSPSLQVTADKSAIARDAYGLALEGVRTPAVDVPTAMVAGTAMPGTEWNPVCSLMGITVPFTPQQLLALYPTHQVYVDKVTAAARAAREAGFILAEEEATIIADALAAPIPH